MPSKGEKKKLQPSPGTNYHSETLFQPKIAQPRHPNLVLEFSETKEHLQNNFFFFWRVGVKLTHAKADREETGNPEAEAEEPPLAQEHQIHTTRLSY